MVEGDGLENRYTCKGIVGSNPTLSAFATLKRGYGVTKSARRPRESGIRSAVALAKATFAKLQLTYGVTKSAFNTLKL